MEEMSTPHLLVIGGTGFIGHHLLKAVQHKSWEVTSVSLTPPLSSRFVEGVRYLHFDMSDLAQVTEYISEDYDFIVNLGGYIDHQLFRDGGRNLIETHFTTLQNLVETISRRNLKRFVQIGSSDEYGNAPAPQHEYWREQPISPYSLAKVSGTHFLQMLHRTEKFPALILRLFLTYGPGQDASRFLPQIIRGCLDNTEFSTSAGEQFRDFCYIEDTIRAILKALVEPEVEGEVFNVASGEPVSIRTMITKVCSLTGSGKPQFGKVLYRPGENMNLYADIKKIQEMLSWSPQVSLEQGLQKTVNWYAEHE